MRRWSGDTQGIIFRNGRPALALYDDVDKKSYHVDIDKTENRSGDDATTAEHAVEIIKL